MVSCAGPKTKTVLHNKQVNTPINKILVFPVTSFKGNQNNSSKTYDPAVVSAWVDLYGKDKVVPGGSPLLKLIKSSGPKTYAKLINSIHDKKDFEKFTSSPWMKKLVSNVTNKFGNYHFAFAISNGSKKRYTKGKPVYLHMALFDTKKMTWKWITKVKSSKSANWTTSTVSMVKSSFDTIEKIEKSSRAPASE